MFEIKIKTQTETQVKIPEQSKTQLNFMKAEWLQDPTWEEKNYNLVDAKTMAFLLKNISASLQAVPFNTAEDFYNRDYVSRGSGAHFFRIGTDGKIYYKKITCECKAQFFLIFKTSF